MSLFGERIFTVKLRSLGWALIQWLAPPLPLLTELSYIEGDNR